MMILNQGVETGLYTKANHAGACSCSTSINRTKYGSRHSRRAQDQLRIRGMLPGRTTRRGQGRRVRIGPALRRRVRDRYAIVNRLERCHDRRSGEQALHPGLAGVGREPVGDPGQDCGSLSGHGLDRCLVGECSCVSCSAARGQAGDVSEAAVEPGC